MDIYTRRSSPPNRLLRYARQEQGWSQQRLAEQIGTTEDVVSRWERGIRMPGPYYREKLCSLFHKTVHELGLLPLPNAEEYQRSAPSVMHEQVKRDIMAHLEQFSFGDLPTTWIVVDGEGMQQYVYQNIVVHFEPKPEELPLELQVKKQQVASQQMANRERGLPFHWNGQRYSLDRFVRSREGPGENMVLDLWLTPSDYYTFLATNMALDEQVLREKYLKTADWFQPVQFFSNSLGIYLAVLTADKKILLTHRSREVGSRPGEYNVSVCEGLGKIDASSRIDEAPDLYACAQRGLQEELGLQENDDFSLSDLHLLSFGVDAWYSQWGLLGMVKVQKAAQAILNYRNAGVKDRLENAQIHLIPFEIEAVVNFVLSHQSWAPGGLACLYHTLVHEFGRNSVIEVITYQTSHLQGK